jgi:hypothetical protein
MKRPQIDDPCELQGEGITRTSDPGATQWPYEVRFNRGRPMTGTIPAIDRHQAQRFLENRHPDAVSVTVLAQAGRGWR